MKQLIESDWCIKNFPNYFNESSQTLELYILSNMTVLQRNKLIPVLLAMGPEGFHQERGVRSRKQFARNVNHIVHIKILGTVSHSKQWKVPINDSGDSVVKVSLSNKKTRTFIDNLDFLEHIFSSPANQEHKRI